MDHEAVFRFLIMDSQVVHEIDRKSEGLDVRIKRRIDSNVTRIQLVIQDLVILLPVWSVTDVVAAVVGIIVVRILLFFVIDLDEYR